MPLGTLNRGTNKNGENARVYIQDIQLKGIQEKGERSKWAQIDKMDKSTGKIDKLIINYVHYGVYYVHSKQSEITKKQSE